MGNHEHYRILFAELERRLGKLSEETLTSIVGFNAGGPVSLCEVPRKSVFVSCELSLYPEQVPSAEGLRFEVLSVGCFDLERCRRMFTAIGALSLESQLGDEHTVDLSEVLDDESPLTVRLRLFSRSEIGGNQYGIYEVRPETKSEIRPLTGASS